MKEEIIENSMDSLGISKKTYDKLKEKNINDIKDLCQIKKKDLKKIGFLQKEILEVEIKLQLKGFNLKIR